mgnify:CR=1 FL=1
MKKLYCLIFPALILLFFSCKKVKLEDTRSQQIIGKWRYSGTGKIISSSNFTKFNSYQYIDYEIEFIEKGEICLSQNSITQTHIIDNVEKLDDAFTTYGQWHNLYGYVDGKNRKYIELHYFGDSVMITNLPYDVSEYGSQAGNMFYRVE